MFSSPAAWRRETMPATSSRVEETQVRWARAGTWYTS